MPHTYDCITQVELPEGAGTIPVGNYNTGMYLSPQGGTQHNFCIMMDTVTPISVLKVTAYDIVNGCSEFEIVFAADGTKVQPYGGYSITTTSKKLVPVIKTGTPTGNSDTVYVNLTFETSVVIVATMDSKGCIIQQCGSVTCDTTVQPRSNNILIEGVDYGNSLPSAANNVGRIFFVKAAT